MEMMMAIAAANKAITPRATVLAHDNISEKNYRLTDFDHSLTYIHLRVSHPQINHKGKTFRRASRMTGIPVPINMCCHTKLFASLTRAVKSGMG
jgi:hypothetical protein